MTERDTHFQGFAKLLYDELFEHTKRHVLDLHYDPEAFTQEQCNIIAKRVYDLVEHAVGTAEWIDTIQLAENQTTASVIHSLPDLTEWPAEPI